MEIEFLNDNNKKLWDEFIFKTDSAWFRHTTSWMKYSSCCRFDSNTKNFSFMVKQNNEIIAIVPLLVEYDYSNREVNKFAMYGDYTPAPAIQNNCKINKKNILDKIIEQINIIASENNVKTGIFSIDPLIGINYNLDFQFFNFLSYGAKVDLKTTNIIDLIPNEADILSAMRKGHKAAIKQVLKENSYAVEIYDKTNITKDKLWTFKEIHKIDSGRITRTDNSWICMLEQIQNNEAILALIYDKTSNQYIAGAFCLTYKKGAYYGSYATKDSGFLNGHVGYLIQWEIIKYLKLQGFTTYDIGRNTYTNEDLTSEKLINIAKYKRGFRNKEFIVINYQIEY